MIDCYVHGSNLCGQYYFIHFANEETIAETDVNSNNNDNINQNLIDTCLCSFLQKCYCFSLQNSLQK